MSTDAPSTFDDDFGWSERIQKAHAVRLYEEHWPGCEVIEVDSASKEEYVAQQLDFGDVDKLIKRSDGTSIHLAQRFRRYENIPGSSQSGEPKYDLTIRCKRENSPHTIEYQRLLNAYESIGSSYPRLYAYGIANPDAGENGFRKFWLIRTDPILEAITSGDLTPSLITNRDGVTGFRVIPIETIRDLDAIVKEWELTKPEPPEEGAGKCERCNKWSWDRSIIDIGTVSVWVCDDCNSEAGGGSDE